MRTPFLCLFVMAALLGFACTRSRCDDGRCTQTADPGCTGDCGGVTAPAPCATGVVTASCACGITTVSSGYCCDGAPQALACAAAQPAGNPDGRCTQALPPEARAADTSSPTTRVGSGTAATCTHAGLAAAVATGGVITFDCGADPVRIPITSTLELPTDRDTVIDGGNKVTLDGGGSVRILSWQSGDWMANTHSLTLQHLVLANGKGTGTEEAIPTRPAPCSQGYNDRQGGALFMRDGILRAVDVTFVNNEAALLGPDTGGGALYLLGVKAAYIAGCSFLNNRASNGGAMGSLFANNFVYDSLFDGNQATGNGANMDDASKCSSMNNGQNQVGSGGNGGAIYNDGAAATSITICGTQIRNSHSNAFGAALFYTSNDGSGSLAIRDSHFFENKQCLDWWEVQPGISMSESVYDPAALVDDVITAPAGWSAEDDPVCRGYIDAFRSQ